MSKEKREFGRLTLRPAVEGDDEVIKALVRGARINPMGLDWRRFTVAVDRDGRVIGCVQHKPHGEIVELASLVVAREWRGRGVARALVVHLQQRLGPPLWLMCTSSLVKFYERFGFREVGERPEMPAYFRRMVRLAGLLQTMSRSEEWLAVMVWEGDKVQRT